MNRLFEYTQNLRGVFYFFLLVLCSCNSGKEKNDCEKLGQGAVVALKGTAEIDSKRRIVFIPKGENGERKVELIPCNERVRGFVLREYDRYVYLKNAGEAFWIAVEGNYVSSDEKKEPPKFIFNFAALLNEQEEAQGRGEGAREGK